MTHASYFRSLPLLCLASEHASAKRRPCFNLALITATILGLCLLAPNVWSQTQGAHTSRFLNLYIDPSELEAGLCAPTDSRAVCDPKLQAEAVSYYKAIGIYDSTSNSNPPAGTAGRGTFNAWKATLGFAQDPNTLTTGETRATYFNNGDLQFGRDMHCRTQSNFATSRVRILQSQTYACYVSNFSTSGKPGSTADAVGSIEQVVSSPPHGPIATVVMERTAIPRLIPVLGSGKKISAVPSSAFGDVRFFAYGADGSPIVTAALDSEGAKALPGLCLACHGGSYQLSTAGTPRVFSGNFLPFDTSTFIFAPDATLTEAAQRDSFRKLNEFVKSTKPRPTIADLIDGWYQWCGGVGKVGCFLDDQNHPFIPGENCSNNATCFSSCPPLTSANPSRTQVTCGWGSAAGIAPTGYGAAGFDARAFYRQVVAKECRTCHIAQADALNVENYSLWVDSQISIQSVLFSNYRMPFGEVPFLDFWSLKPVSNGKTAKDLMKGYFGCPPVSPSTLTGDGSDNVTVSVIANTVPIDQVEISLTLGNGVTGCPQHCWWKAIHVAGFEIGEQDATQSGSIRVPVNVMPSNATFELWKAKTFGIHTQVQTAPLPSQFTYGGCTIAFQWNKDK